MAKRPLSEEALKALKECTVDGMVVKLPGEQLERSVYLDVKKHLEMIGGKWKGGKIQGFVFDRDPTELLAAQQNGEGRDLKQEFQFFYTPDAVAKRMMVYAKPIMTGAGKDFKIMEPSAGSGHLVAAAQKYLSPDIEVDCFELMDVNRLRLAQVKGARLLGNDFLEAEATGTLANAYDLIIANPPFNKNQDIDHIQAMYRCLKTNGRIITIASPSWTFGSQKKQESFRKWLDDLDATQEELEAGSFKEAGTNIKAMLLVIDKLEVEEFPVTGNNSGDSGISKTENGIIPPIGGINTSVDLQSNAAVSKILDYLLEPADTPERKCRVCGCTDLDCRQCIEKTGEPCSWVEQDLCSACVPEKSASYPIPPPNIVVGTPSLSIPKSSKSNSNMKKLTIQREPFLAVLKKVKEVVSKHPTLDIVSNILINVRLADLQIIATDLQVTIMGDVPCTHEEKKPFSFLLPFDFTFDTCKAISSDSFEIETDLETAVILGSNDRYDIRELSKAKDFPAMPDLPADHSTELNSNFTEWLNRGLDTVLLKDNLRPAMGKVLVDVRGSSVAVASTNANSIFEKTFPISSDQAQRLLISPIVVKALKGFEKTSINWNDSHIAFQSENITLLGTIQDEKFPNYSNMLENPRKANVTFNRAELVTALEKIAIANATFTEFHMKREIGLLVIEAQGAENNRKVEVTIPMDYSGPCDKILFTPDILLKLLKQVDFEKISMAIYESNKAVILTSEVDPDYTALIMPRY